MASSIINSDDGVVSGTSGLKTTGGDDGVLVFQSKGTETARINTDSQIVAAAGTASLPALTTTGDVNTGIYFPAADNIAFTTGGTIRGRWTTDGLCFGSDTAAANALDDYEEGTYTVELFDAGSGGNASSTTTTGYYTKIGNIVTCRFGSLSSISTAGMTTNVVLYISLPFSASSSVGSSGSVAISNIVSRQGTAVGYVVPFVNASNARGRFYGCKPDTAIVSIRPAEITSGELILYTLTYQTA